MQRPRFATSHNTWPRFATIPNTWMRFATSHPAFHAGLEQTQRSARTASGSTTRSLPFLRFPSLFFAPIRAFASSRAPFAFLAFAVLFLRGFAASRETRLSFAFLRANSRLRAFACAFCLCRAFSFPTHPTPQRLPQPHPLQSHYAFPHRCIKKFTDSCISPPPTPHIRQAL